AAGVLAGCGVRVRCGRWHGRVRNVRCALSIPYVPHRRAPAGEPLMSPKELKSLMARTRTSSPMLAEVLEIAPQQIRKWRAGTRPVPERHMSAMRLLFRDRAESLGLEPRSLPEIPERVDPREIEPAPIEHAIEARDEPLPQAGGATLVEAINSLVAML